MKAISVNPLDTNVRRGTIPPPENENMPRILGWDAAGEVIAAGSDCTLFQKGDVVYYTGSITRPGTNCEFHLVDERIVGRKPKSLSFEEAAPSDILKGCFAAKPLLQTALDYLLPYALKKHGVVPRSHLLIQRDYLIYYIK